METNEGKSYSEESVSKSLSTEGTIESCVDPGSPKGGETQVSRCRKFSGGGLGCGLGQKLLERCTGEKSFPLAQFWKKHLD